MEKMDHDICRRVMLAEFAITLYFLGVFTQPLQQQTHQKRRLNCRVKYFST